MFSIVTVNYNGEKFLDFFLASLVNQKFSEFKLYFVDNGSKDNSLSTVNKYISSLDIEVLILDENNGFAKANNIGIDLAMRDSNEFVITLNNDIELAESCLLNLKNRLESLKDTYDVFQMLMLNYYERDVIDTAGLGFKEYYCTYQIGYKKNISFLDSYKSDVQGVCAGAAVYSKKSLNAIKESSGDYFDSRFFAYYEDVDLSLRLLKKGFKSFLIKDAIVYHIHSGTSSEGSPFKAFYLTRNLLLYLNKNLTRTEFRKYSIYYLGIFLKTQFNYLIHCKINLIRSSIKGYLDYRKLRMKKR